MFRLILLSFLVILVSGHMYLNQGRNRRRMPGYHYHNRDHCAASRRTWVIGLPGQRTDFNYIDNSTMMMGGLAMEIIDAVCKQAGKKCKCVVVPMDVCWDAKRGIGDGLLAGYVDACAPFDDSPERSCIFEFQNKMMFKKQPAKFIMKKGAGHHFRDLRTLTVGTAAGLSSSKMCMKRLGLMAAKVMEIPYDYMKMQKKLDMGEVDVIFMDGHMTKFINHDMLPGSEMYHCSKTGSGVMFPNHSDEFRCWWNKAYTQFTMSGKMMQLCMKHGLLDQCNCPTNMGMNHSMNNQNNNMMSG